MAVLKVKAKGKEVKELQKALNKSIGSKLELDGEFGKLTEASLKKFQKKNSLKPDGVAGSSTLAVIGLGPSNAIPKMKIEDCSKKLASWQKGGTLQAHGGPEYLNKEMIEVKKILKEVEAKFVSMVKVSQTAQQDVDKYGKRVIEALYEIVKHQDLYARSVKGNDVEIATDMVKGAEFFFSEYKKRLALHDAAKDKQDKLLDEKFNPTIDKLIAALR